MTKLSQIAAASSSPAQSVDTLIGVQGGAVDLQYTTPQLFGNVGTISGGNTNSSTLTLQSTSAAGTTDSVVVKTASQVQRVLVDTNGNVIFNTAAVATNATNGFIYIATCAGTPTGVPTSYTGRVPIVYDTTNHKIWVYDTAWKGVVVA
jgi:hypothetical protein